MVRRNLTRQVVRPLSWPIVRPLIDLFFDDNSIGEDCIFSRASTGTRFNGARTLVSEAINAPCFDYDPATGRSLGLLIEPQTTNETRYSWEAENWTKSNGTVSVSSTLFLDASTDARQFTKSSSAYGYVGYGPSGGKVASALMYRGDVFVKKVKGRYFSMRMQGTYPARADVVFDLDTGTVSTEAYVTSGFADAGASISYKGDGWYKCGLWATTDATTSLNCYMAPNDNGVAIGASDSIADAACLLCGLQIYTGSAERSYIATSGSSVTRAADQLSFAIPSGVTRLRYTFDDDTYQDVSVSAGAYAVPTTLNRRHIKRIQGFAS